MERIPFLTRKRVCHFWSLLFRLLSRPLLSITFYSGIYKLVNENEKFGISKEQCAKSVLPFLVSTCVENTLNLNQFEQFVLLIHQLLSKVHFFGNYFCFFVIGYV